MSRLRTGYSQRCVYYFIQNMFKKGKPNDQNCLLWVLELVCFQGRTEGEQEGHQVSRSNHTAITIALITINTITDRPSVTPDCDKFDSVWHKKCGRKAPSHYSTSLKQKKEQGKTNVKKLTKTKKECLAPHHSQWGVCQR